MIKTYQNEHSCLLASKYRKVTVVIIARKYGKVINAMPFIKPSYLRALVRKDFGVIVSPHVCRAAKGKVIKQMNEKYKKEFQKLNNYVKKLKATNLGSTVIVISKNAVGDSEPIFDRLYICFVALKEGFLGGCRHIIGLDGFFLKGLVKGQLLVAVGRDGNNQMFPIAYAVVHNESTETWFIDQLYIDLNIGEGLGWFIVSDMQKV